MQVSEGKRRGKNYLEQTFFAKASTNQKGKVEKKKAQQGSSWTISTKGTRRDRGKPETKG